MHHFSSLWPLLIRGVGGEGEETVSEHLLGSVTPSTWSIDVLSMITTECALIPLNGCRIGKRQLLINSSNLSPFTDPSSRQTSWTPSKDMIGKADRGTHRLKILWSLGGLPLTAYARFRILWRLLQPLSSIHNSMDGSYTLTSAQQLRRSMAMRLRLDITRLLESCHKSPDSSLRHASIGVEKCRVHPSG